MDEVFDDDPYRIRAALLNRRLSEAAGQIDSARLEFEGILGSLSKSWKGEAAGNFIRKADSGIEEWRALAQNLR